MLGAGGTALWASTTQRHGGYVHLGTATYSTAGYAVASKPVELSTVVGGWDAASSLFGTVRLQVTSPGSATPVFLGIAPAAAGSRYLAGVAYVSVTGTTSGHGTYTWHSGGAPLLPPAQASIWAAHVNGTGLRTLTWPVRNGSWTVIAMNADRSRPVEVRIDLAATLPALAWVTAALLAGGVIILTAGAALIAVPVRRASR